MAGTMSKVTLLSVTTVTVFVLRTTSMNLTPGWLLTAWLMAEAQPGSPLVSYIDVPTGK
jgi:hypothetical protein